MTNLQNNDNQVVKSFEVIKLKDLRIPIDKFKECKDKFLSLYSSKLYRSESIKGAIIFYFGDSMIKGTIKHGFLEVSEVNIAGPYSKAVLDYFFIPILQFHSRGEIEFIASCSTLDGNSTTRDVWWICS
jgi:hypothetical protein